MFKSQGLTTITIAFYYTSSSIIIVPSGRTITCLYLPWRSNQQPSLEYLGNRRLTVFH